MSRLRCNWFTQWNYIAPLYWLYDWFKPRATKICKGFLKVVIIAFAFFYAPSLSESAGKVIASYTDEIELREQQRQAEILHAQEVEREFRRKEQEKIRRAMEDAQYNERLKLKELQETEEEIRTTINEYDWILITWWGDDSHWTGIVTPTGNFPGGQVRKIENDHLYGTWGPDPLIYPHDVFHVCTKKEVTDANNKEQLRRDKLNNKKSKTRKSWGLHPATCK